jgi:hypothetical protein
LPAYADSALLRDARSRYFAENGLGEGGYDARWVKLKLGPAPLFFPNTAGRVRAVRLHDVHHVLTEYATDWIGEAEIGAWEVGAGCADHWAAWVLNLSALSVGFWMGPRRVLRAFARGRRSRSLYPGEWDDALLDESVGALRSRIGLAVADPAPARTDRLALAGWLGVGGVLLVAWTAVSLAPLALLIWLLI